MAKNNDINIRLNLIIKQFIEAMKKAGLETGDLEKDLKAIGVESKKSFGKAKTGAKDTENAVKGVLSKFKEWRGSFTEINQGIELSRKALALFKKALDISIEFKNASRDAEETRNKFDEVFSSIKELANSTALELAESFGLADSTAKKLLASTGDILVGFGFAEEEALNLSKEVVSLSQDLASFTNMEGGADRATEALTKALVGETESVKAMGIVIRQGTADYKARYKEIMRTTGASETQAKAVTNLRIAQEQSTKAQGDYARTSESLANVERRRTEMTKELYETIGDKLAPAFLTLNELAVEFMDSIAPTEVDKVNEGFRDQKIDLHILVSKWEELNSIEEKTKEELELYEQVIKDLKDQYPTYLKNLDLEQESYDKIQKAIELTNLELEKRHINTLRIAEQAEFIAKLGKAQIAIQKAEDKNRKLRAQVDFVIRKNNADETEENIKKLIQQSLAMGMAQDKNRLIIEANNKIIKDTKIQIKKLDEFYERLTSKIDDNITTGEKELAQLDKIQRFFTAFSDGDYGKSIRILTEDVQGLIDSMKYIPPVKTPITLDIDDSDLVDEDEKIEIPATIKFEADEMPLPPKFLVGYETDKQSQLQVLKDQEEMFEDRKAIEDEFLKYGVITKDEYLLKEKELREQYKQEEEKDDEEMLFIEALERRLDGVEQFYNSVNQIASNLAQVELNQLKKQYKDEKKLLDNKLKNGVISKREYDKEIAILDNKSAEAERKIKEKQRDWSYGLAVIDGAKAITGIWATWSANPIFASILTALAVASTLTQLEVISSQTFGDGGVSDGPSHSQGGIDLFSNVSGRHLGNIEGGEGIVNKRAMSNPLARTAVSAINELFGGRRFPNTMRRGGMTPRSYQRGGVAPLADNESVESNAIVQEIKELIFAVYNIPAPIINITNESDISDLTTEVMNEIGDKSRNNLDTDEIMQIGQRG